MDVFVLHLQLRFNFIFAMFLFSIAFAQHLRGSVRWCMQIPTSAAWFKNMSCQWIIKLTILLQPARVTKARTLWSVGEANLLEFICVCTRAVLCGLIFFSFETDVIRLFLEIQLLEQVESYEMNFLSCAKFAHRWNLLARKLFERSSDYYSSLWSMR